MFRRTEFERVTPESVGIASQDVNWLVDQLESGFTEPHGLMIMRHGKVCAEGWWAPFAPGIRHGQQSHSKTYAATAVGIAFTEGLLKLDERLIDIFPEEAPEEPSENLKLLTIRDVLCMGCGMDQMPPATEYWIRDFLATPVNHKPGTTYMYNSTGSTMLGAIVRKKTGLGLQEYLKPRLFDKIGIDCSNHRWMCMPDGMEIGGGGLFCTTEDNLRLMKLYADGGKWNGEQILSPEYVKLATSLQNESATEALVNPPATDNFLGYGFQIWMCQPKGVYRADGAMGQFTIVFPDQDMIIAITENAGGAHWAQKTLDTMWAFLDRVKAADKDASLPEDPEASGRLARRMQMLALPKPACTQIQPAGELTGKVYRCAEGAIYLDPYCFGRIMTGEPMPPKMDELEFGREDCRILISYTQEGVPHRIYAACDGSWAENIIGDAVVRRALCSAAWMAEDRLQLTVRWVETCNTQTILFFFSERQIHVTVSNTMMSFTQPDQVIHFVR